LKHDLRSCPISQTREPHPYGLRPSQEETVAALSAVQAMSKTKDIKRKGLPSKNLMSTHHKKI